MYCNKCQKDMRRCHCLDADERIEALSKSPFLSINWEALKAERFLAKHEIEAAREAAKQKTS